MTEDHGLHKERAHARLSPSGASRWSTCFASVQLEQAYPESHSSYADEGTACHQVAEECLRDGLNASVFDEAQIEIREGVTIQFTPDLAEGVQTYVDYVRDVVGTDGELLVEQRLDISRWVPECFGTSDAVILKGDELIVCDLKAGRGVKVDAEENKQLILYALGAYDAFSLAQDFTHVRMVICQPFLNTVSEWSITVDELLSRGEALKELADRASIYLDSETPPVSSDYAPSLSACRFCKARADCVELARANIEVLSGRAVTDINDFDVVEPTAETQVVDLARMMDQAEMIEVWIKAVRAEVERRLFQGLPVDGYKLVQGKRGARAWTDEAQAEQTLKSFRLKKEDMYTFKLVSPAQAEKLLKKEAPRRWAKLETMMEQREGSASVAPASDKRPVFVPQASSTDDFEDMT